MPVHAHTHTTPSTPTTNAYPHMLTETHAIQVTARIHPAHSSAPLHPPRRLGANINECRKGQ